MTNITFLAPFYIENKLYTEPSYRNSPKLTHSSPPPCLQADAESDSDDDTAAAGSNSTSTDAAGNDDLALINALTGAPLEGDSLLYVVPVCGPYSIMNNFKFKVKLTPGI